MTKEQHKQLLSAGTSALGRDPSGHTTVHVNHAALQCFRVECTIAKHGRQSILRRLTPSIEQRQISIMLLYSTHNRVLSGTGPQIAPAYSLQHVLCAARNQFLYEYDKVVVFLTNNTCFDLSLSRQALVVNAKKMGICPGLKLAQVAQVLGEERGSHAGLVVAIMEAKGLGRIDFYEVSCALRVVIVSPMFLHLPCTGYLLLQGVFLVLVNTTLPCKLCVNQCPRLYHNTWVPQHDAICAISDKCCRRSLSHCMPISTPNAVRAVSSFCIFDVMP